MLLPLLLFSFYFEDSLQVAGAVCGTYLAYLVVVVVVVVQPNCIENRKEDE